MTDSMTTNKPCPRCHRELEIREHQRKPGHRYLGCECGYTEPLPAWAVEALQDVEAYQSIELQKEDVR